MSNKETKEIKEENLEDVSGGYVLKTGNNYKAIDRQTGNKIYEGKNYDEAHKMDVGHNS